MKPEEIEQGWHWTRAGRRFRQRIVDPIGHEAWRRLIRETYPAQLPPDGSGWWDRFGREVIKVQPDPDVVAHAHHLLERARRAGTVVVGPADRDEVYVAQVERRGRGVCSGWADEEDYGPRYT